MLLVLTACVVQAPPQGAAGYPQAGSGYPPAEPEVSAASLSGYWCFQANGRALENHLDVQGRTMIAQPVNRAGGPREYHHSGPMLYQEAGGRGTYEFLSNEQAIWRSNDDRNMVLRLNRC